MMTQRITVRGIVQGVGYRPFVAERAENLGICGMVQNIAGIVRITVTGEQEKLESFLQIIKQCKPDGARIDRVEVEEIPSQTFSSFSIVSGQDAQITGQQGSPFIIPDLPTCPVCSRELFDPKNRRYRYPFISCVSCGPRYSILRALPYDRETTTMGLFPMCPSCRDEYTTKGNRRRHAQTIACHECGPQLRFGSLEKEEALQEAIRVIRGGGIVAVKDIGGFHLACSPFKEKTVSALRLLKEREKKPFAVMFNNVNEIRDYAYVAKEEERALHLPARPIVLVRKREDGKKLTDGVCGGSADIGAMLPCNPLQMLLLDELGPLIMTSANPSGEPIIIENQDMSKWFGLQKDIPVELGILSHDRQITMPLDDSVMRVVNGKNQIFRRARGFVPEPIWLSGNHKKNVFAAGGDLKSCFCLATDDRAYMSQYLGDLDNVAVSDIYQSLVASMETLFSCKPEILISDMHPGYVSTQMVHQMDEVNNLHVYQVQHHHAHVASVIAEHGLTNTTLGVAFDGTGYGTDKTIWGSEFLLCEENRMERIAHLEPVEMPGGDSAAKNTLVSLCSYILNSSDESMWTKFLNRGLMELGQAKTIKAALLHHINTMSSSSMGRLFDAVSALLGICFYNDYEGQAAIMLEQAAEKTENPYTLHIPIQRMDGRLQGNTSVLFGEILDALESEIDVNRIARGFIDAVADYTVNTCLAIFDDKSYNSYEQIALCGGTFQNRILLEKVENDLIGRGVKVYRNEQVPPGDGGICLGQQYIGSFIE